MRCLGTHPRAAFFRQALTPDLKHWSGRVLLDEAHLGDPLRWRNSALIAGGFHCDWALLSDEDRDRVLAVMALCPQHRFLMLSKRPDALLGYISGCVVDGKLRADLGRAVQSICNNTFDGYVMDAFRKLSLAFKQWPWPLLNVWPGCSVMTQADADAHREPMRQLAAAGWHTHAWHEPAIGPVDWRGWEFLKLLVQGGESGPTARPMHPQWARDARDWCAGHGVVYLFKQQGEWIEAPMISRLSPEYAKVRQQTVRLNPENKNACAEYIRMTRVGKRAAGHLLDGREHRELPEGLKV